jgi:hypothetical protein
MSQILARTFLVDGNPAAGYKLIIGALGGVTPLDYTPVGQEGLLKEAITVPATGIVAVEIQSDERYTISLYDMAGDLAYREDVASSVFAAMDVTTEMVAPTDIIGIALETQNVVVADNATFGVDVFNLFGNGSQALATTGITAVSTTPATATVAYAAGVATITGVNPGSTTVTISRTLTNGETVTRVIAVTVTA